MMQVLLGENKNQLPVMVDVPRRRVLRCTSFRIIFLALCFYIFLYPLSLRIGGDGVSANYLFTLFPAIILLARGTLQLPSKNLRAIIILYVLVFVLATTHQFSYVEHLERRVISFVIFMSMFVYMFIKIDSQMVQSFKLAIVEIAIFFSLNMAFSYNLLGGNVLGFDAKGVVGSQRYGFVFVLAIWLLIHYFPRSKSLFFLKFVGLLVLGAGLLLTFSRSGVVAVVGSFGIYMAYNIWKWFKTPNLSNIKYILTAAFSIAILSIVIMLLYKFFHSVFDFYVERVFSLKQASGVNTYDFHDPDSSEGFRVAMFDKVIEFVASNPFTGSGYLGVWILFDDLSGSAHNQYLDVLFRTGVLGFSAYVFLIYRLLRFLHLREPGLFWGVIGILLYGLVHETFKLSQGAFVLAFLLGMMVQPRSGKPRADLAP